MEKKQLLLALIVVAVILATPFVVYLIIKKQTDNYQIENNDVSVTQKLEEVYGDNLVVNDEVVNYQTQNNFSEDYFGNKFQVKYPKNRKVYNPVSKDDIGFALCPINHCQDNEMSINFVTQNSLEEWIVTEKELFQNSYWINNLDKYQITYFSNLRIGNHSGIGLEVICKKEVQCAASDTMYAVFRINDTVFETHFETDNDIHHAILGSLRSTN